MTKKRELSLLHSPIKWFFALLLRRNDFVHDISTASQRFEDIAYGTDEYDAQAKDLLGELMF